jgi:hypothetical protein
MPSDQPVSDASINQEDEVLSRRQMVAAGGGLVAAGAAMSGMFPSRSEAQTVDDQGVGAMLSGFIPANWFWRIRTETIPGWNTPANFTPLDGRGYYVTAPFTGSPSQALTPQFNTWLQNTAGAAVFISLPVGIVELAGQDGHIYLESSPDGTTIYRLGFLGLRTGPQPS